MGAGEGGHVLEVAGGAVSVCLTLRCREDARESHREGDRETAFPGVSMPSRCLARVSASVAMDASQG